MPAMHAGDLTSRYRRALRLSCGACRVQLTAQSEPGRVCLHLRLLLGPLRGRVRRVCPELSAGRTGLCVLQYRPVSLSPLPSGFDRERSWAPSRLCDDSRAVAAKSTRGGRAHTETSQAEPPTRGPSRCIEAGNGSRPSRAKRYDARACASRAHLKVTLPLAPLGA